MMDPTTAPARKNSASGHREPPRERTREREGDVALEREVALDAVALPLPGAAESPILARRSWPEVLAMTLAPPLATAWLAPDDPLLLSGQFPWFVLVPVLIGVQHGALAAGVSASLLAGAGAAHQLLGGATPAAALAAFAGGCLAAGVVAGHFHDRVQARLERLDRESKEAAQRLARLARVHAVVKLSHQRLEERLAAQRWSLVSAFEDARRALAGQRSLGGIGDVVLHVLSTHAQVQSATLLTLGRDERRRQRFEARARIGNPPGFDPRHALVRRALDSGRLVALDAESADAEHDVLAVAPLVTASGRLLGLVSIHEMPFMAFQAENLKGLAALAALLADMLEDRFIEAHAGDELVLGVVPDAALAGVDAPHGKGLDAPHATAAPSSETRAIGDERADERAGDERATEEWLEEELAATELVGPSERGEPSGGGEGGEGGSDGFAGTRTGTHRRRGVAQSA